MTIDPRGMHYVMSKEEVASAEAFISTLQAILPRKDCIELVNFIEHLLYVQNPLSPDYCPGSSFEQGINTATNYLLADKSTSKSLILAALGYDWEKFCGDKRVKVSTFPDVEKDVESYEAARANKSAMLFCAEMQEFFTNEELIDQVYNLIRNRKTSS